MRKKACSLVKLGWLAKEGPCQKSPLSEAVRHGHWWAWNRLVTSSVASLPWHICLSAGGVELLPGSLWQSLRILGDFVSGVAS